MNEKEYRKHPAQNYSLLARFNESQDHALLAVENKSYFEEGKAFERLLCDTIKGTDLFGEKFCVDDTISGDMPDVILSAFEAHEDLSNMYVYTKAGDLNKTHKRRHAWLDSFIKNPGKLPIPRYTYNEMRARVLNVLKVEILGLPMSEILKDAKFQVPILWKDDLGIEKKALIDFLAVVDIFGDVTEIPIDLKSTANLMKFRSDLKYRCWIQDRHYSEGIKRLYKNPFQQMVFLASDKTAPFIAQPFYIDGESLPYATEKYKELSLNCSKWVKEGRPKKGWKPAQYVKIFFE